MNAEPGFGPRILTGLRRMGLDGLSALLIEGLAPLSLLGSQLLYLAEPLVDSPRIRQWAEYLQDPQRLDDLADRLYQGEDEGP